MAVLNVSLSFCKLFLPTRTLKPSLVTYSSGGSSRGCFCFAILCFFIKPPKTSSFRILAISEAAIIAACNSSAEENTKVPVDYTLVKNVKKPSGALPGKVVCYTNNMIYVIADKTKITEKKSG